MAPDIPGRFDHVLQVGRAVFVRRRTDGNKLDIAVRNAGCNIRGKLQPARSAIAVNQGFEAGLIDRHAAAVQQIDFLCINIKAKNIVA